MIIIKIEHILYFILLIVQCKSDCVTPVNTMKNVLVFDKNNNIQYPNDGQGNIVKKNGQFITLACPGSELNIIPMSKAGDMAMSFSCSNNAYSYSNNDNNITCMKTLISRERRIGNCGAYYNLQIGYQFTGRLGQFIPHIDLCYDNGKKLTLWTYAKLRKSIGECHFESNSNRPRFRSGNYFKSSLAKMYMQFEQVANLKSTYDGVPEQINTENLFEIGNLVGKCDFVYDAQQRLTFHYTNSAPQWKSFNEGNWKTLETNIRNLLRNENADLDVYTGTFDRVQINGKDYYLDSKNSLIPVPKYFWKVVIKREESRTLGVAIVGSNDIFGNSVDPCSDIMGSIHWMNIPKAKSRLSGYMIACELSDFMNMPGLAELPNFPDVTGILTGNVDVPVGS